MPIGASFGGNRLQDAADDAVAHQDDVGIVGVPVFGAGFALLRLAVLGFELAVCALRDRPAPCGAR